MSQGFYRKRLIANNNRPVPEARLLLMMIGAPFLAGGLFIFAWTSSPDIPWIGSVIGAACIGFGFFTIIPATLNYLVDTFTVYAASAVATFTFLRCILAGAFSLVALPCLSPFILPLLSSTSLPPNPCYTSDSCIGISVPQSGRRMGGQSTWIRGSSFDTYSVSVRIFDLTLQIDGLALL
jgi:hypothetical protein